MVIAVIGSGGKTTLVKKLAREYAQQGKRVLVTTSTHMFVEEDTLLTDDPEVIIDRLERTGYAMAGTAHRPDKFCPLSGETYRQVCSHADVVLVEADGSRHMPLKFPREDEPVIPENTDRIILVWGPHGLHKPAKQVVQRLELVPEHLGIREDTIITMDHVRLLLQEGYLIPLAQQYPQVPVEVYPPL